MAASKVRKSSCVFKIAGVLQLLSGIMGRFSADPLLFHLLVIIL